MTDRPPSPLLFARVAARSVMTVGALAAIAALYSVPGIATACLRSRCSRFWSRSLIGCSVAREVGRLMLERIIPDRLVKGRRRPSSIRCRARAAMRPRSRSSMSCRPSSAAICLIDDDALGADSRSKFRASALRCGAASMHSARRSFSGAREWVCFAFARRVAEAEASRFCRPRRRRSARAASRIARCATSWESVRARARRGHRVRIAARVCLRATIRAMSIGMRARAAAVSSCGSIRPSGIIR